MFPYTMEEAEWLSGHADSHDWLLGQSDFEPAALIQPANDDKPSRDRR